MLLSFRMGVYLAFLYDLIRLSRGFLFSGKAVGSIEDVIFWFYCTRKVFVLMNQEGDGILRWFASAGALLGICLYLELVSPFLIRISAGIFRRIKRFTEYLSEKCRKSN